RGPRPRRRAGLTAPRRPAARASAYRTAALVGLGSKPAVAPPWPHLRCESAHESSRARNGSLCWRERCFHLFRRHALGYDGAGTDTLSGDRRLTGERTMQRSCLAVVLAAGEGTRMRSARPKVLHAVANQSLLAHVLDAVGKAGGTTTAVVVGPGADAVAGAARRVLPDAEIFVQAERRGTAHAVLAAKDAI